jgi:D-alanyl-D-alanine endopeptidase (penicillin-binding protein 7)
MKKILVPLILMVIVLSISRITYNGWFWRIDRLEGLSSIWKPPLPLQTIRINQKAYKSCELPIKSEAAVVLNANRGEILFEKNMEEKLPIASITKLMTSLVFLETNPNLNDTATITPADAEGAGWSQLKIRETFTLYDLLHASLMSSNNRVTRTLARSCGLRSDEFIDRMNQKAKKIGMINTIFFEPTGLDTNNRATALDCARLLYFAQKESLIGSIMGKTTYQFSSLGRRKRMHQIRNTNRLLFASLTPKYAGNVRCGKTGYNGASGYCLSTLVEGRDGEEIIAVVLGAPSSGTRFKEIKSIVEWSIRGEKSEIPPEADDGS